MSAPDTNLKKQQRRHAGPLIGMVAVVVLAVLLFLGYLAYTAGTETPEPDATQVTPEQGLPAEGAPVMPRSQPEGTPQVIEPQPQPSAPDE